MDKTGTIDASETANESGAKNAQLGAHLILFCVQ